MSDVLAQERDPNNEHLDSNDHWQPVGLLVRQFVRRVSRPLPTVIMMLENAGLPVEAN